jgi:hypothetical protein
MEVFYIFLFPDTENKFSYFKRAPVFSGTIMVQFKANSRKIKQSILIELTKLMGIV